MKVPLILLSAMIAGPALAQPVYKCPQTDGSLHYQSARCSEGTRIPIKDNGVVTGPANALPAATPVATPQPAQPLLVRPQRSVTESQAWKGNERIIRESTQTINTLNRLHRP
jgi:hypothetical protein